MLNNVACVVYKSLNGMGPVYLRDLLAYYNPKRDGLRHDPLSRGVPETELVTYHSTKKASNHHANLPLEMYSFTL